MNLRGQYIEISSEEEMEKASKWFELIGYTNNFGKTYVKDKTYLFVRSNNEFHFNNGDKQSYWKPFSILYDEGMPRDVLMGYRTAEITGSIGHIARDEEDLLSKAKRLYPIGTQYKSAAGDYEVHTVESMDWAPSPSGHIYGEMSKGCIYKNGKWAEIVHEAKPIEKWSVDTYVVFFNNSTNHGVKLGTIDKIKYNLDKVGYAWFEDYGCCDRSRLDVDVKWFATLEEAEKFAATIKQSVEKKEFIPDDNLFNYIGRYLEALVDLPNGGKVKKGEYGLIINHSQANFPSQIGYHCSEALKKNNLNIRYRLMPEGFTPLVKEEEWKPQIDEWCYTDEFGVKLFKVYKIAENRIYNNSACWVHKDHSSFRKATQEEIDSVEKPGINPQLISVVVDKTQKIIETPKAEVLTSNQTTYQPIVTSYSYNGVKETHQSINIEGKKFSPIKAELIKVKQLKIN